MKTQISKLISECARELRRWSKALIIALLLAVVAALLVTRGMRVGEHRMVLGPRQFEEDRTSAGGVLCIWALYLAIQAETAACGLPRRPVDDAIDNAIVAIDEFILTNSSLHPTRAMLEDFKRRAAESELRGLRQSGLQQFCQSRDLEALRSPSAEQIQASVKELLAVPREPVMNPCL
jgi:hypothetical protein